MFNKFLWKSKNWMSKIIKLFNKNALDLNIEDETIKVINNWMEVINNKFNLKTKLNEYDFIDIVNSKFTSEQWEDFQDKCIMNKLNLDHNSINLKVKLQFVKNEIKNINNNLKFPFIWSLNEIKDLVEKDWNIIIEKWNSINLNYNLWKIDIFNNWEVLVLSNNINNINFNKESFSWKNKVLDLLEYIKNNQWWLSLMKKSIKFFHESFETEFDYKNWKEYEVKANALKQVKCVIWWENRYEKLPLEIKYDIEWEIYNYKWDIWFKVKNIDINDKKIMDHFTRKLKSFKESNVVLFNESKMLKEKLVWDVDMNSMIFTDYVYYDLQKKRDFPFELLKEIQNRFIDISFDISINWNIVKYVLDNDNNEIIMVKTYPKEKNNYNFLNNNNLLHTIQNNFKI